jgi:hypothetical protein
MVRRRGRWAATAIAAAVAALAATVGTGPAGALLPRDSLEPPELPVEAPFEPPASGFAWMVPANFGPMRNGLVDYRWNEAAGSRHSGPAYTYDPGYVRPTARTAFFDGCPTKAEADAGSSTAYVYAWSLHDPATGAALGPAEAARNCQWSRELDLDPETGRSAPVKVRLTITTTDGSPYPGYPAGKTFDEQVVAIRDILIVSLGDSYGSGEGAPDVPQVIDHNGFLVSPARWVDRRCHRSANAPSAMAARQIEAADPHSTVTFLSFACSGATISTPYFHDQAQLDPYRPSPGLEPNGTGVLGPYRGIEPPNRDDYSEAAMLPSQVAQLRYALTNGDPGVAPRHVDALTLSAGGNDMGFGPVALVCTLYYECKDHFVSGARGEGPVRLSVRFGQSVATMAARYTALGAELATLPIAKTYITQYPDPSRGPGGALCPAILDDVIPGWMAPFLGLVAVAESLPPPLPPYQIDGGDRPDGGEVGWAGGPVLAGMNGAVAAGAVSQGWTLVDGIADGSANLFSGHGYCAADNWIRTATESVAMQGPWHPPLVCNALFALVNPIDFFANCFPPASALTTGTLHPTARGYQAIAGRLVSKLRPDLLPPASGAAPAPVLAEDRGAAVAGSDGWLTGAVAAHTCAAGAAACAPVRVTATVAAPTSLQGAGLSVNGSPLACPAGGATSGPVTCRSELTSPQAHTWWLSFSGDGVHQVEAVATASNGTRAEAASQVKVDLRDPVEATATPSAAVPPTGGWYRSPVEVALTGADAPGGSGMAAIEYQLNGGPVQSVAHGSSVRLEADGEHTLTFRPVDRAGRRGPVQAPLAVRIDQTPPEVACGAADGQWHGADVSVGCTAGDGGSGLALPGDASFTLATAVPAGSETASAATESRQVCDVAGNCTAAGPVGGHRVDRKGPEVRISSPAAARYLVNEPVSAAYECSDGGSGVASCTGPVATGAAVDTGSAGARQFSVEAADGVGNRSQATVSYSVGYRACLRYDPDRPRNAGSTVPVEVQVCDAAGANLSSADLVVTAVGVVHAATGAAVPLQSPGRSQPGDHFTFGGGSYTFNVGTSGYGPGRYELRFTVAGDPAVHAAPFTIR